MYYTGLAGKDNVERAQADSLIDYVADVYDPIYMMVKEKTLEKLV